MSDRKLLNFENALQYLADDKGFYKELLDIWFGETQFDKAILGKLMLKDNKSESASYVHRMKGAIGALGGEKLFDAAQKVENIFRGKSTGSVTVAIENLDTLYKQTNDALMAIKTTL